MKVIFLGIDGVLNDDSFLIKARSKSVFEKDADEIDPVRVALLNQIIDRTGAKVVISSSWRIILKLVEIRELLSHHGFRGEVISKTPSIQRPGRIRGDEIQAWLDADRALASSPTQEFPMAPNRLFYRPVSHFVILDDDADMGALLPHLVQTHAATGLVESDVERAVGLLDRGP